MFLSGLRKLGLTIAMATGLAMVGTAAGAEPTYVGPTACKDCHSAEFAVWEKTPHALSEKEIHKTDLAKAVTPDRPTCLPK